MKLTSINSLLLWLIIFTACSPNRSEDNLKVSKYCANEISLFSVPDSLQSIKIDYSLKPDSFFNTIANKLNKDLCWKMTSFGLKLNTSEPIKVQLFDKCEDGINRCGFRRPEVRILLNQTGKLMIERDIIPIDSVKYWIYKHFPNSVEYDLEEISFEWAIEANKDSIEKVFSNIIDGYLLKYEKLAKVSFSKNICNISKSQVDSLKSILPFKVRLGIKRIIKLPPIPSSEKLKTKYKLDK
ncbi:MAG: hypothetical protein R2852_04370 [Bacteroidia bacterium]